MTSKGAAFGRRITGQSLEQACDAGAVEGCRHDEEAQIFAKAALGVAGEGEAEVGVERALVEFVEQHGADAVEGRDRRERGG